MKANSPILAKFLFNYRLIYFWLLLGIGGFTSCTDECETTITYTVQDPIFMTRSAMVNAVQSQPAKTLSTPGKIYSYGDYVLINELYKGIHIIDNTNPAAPKNIAFLNIPGNVDMAIRDNILFADAGPDLLALDITDPNNVVLKNHTFNLFPNNIYQNISAPANPTLSDNITVGYNSREVIEKRPCTEEAAPTRWGGGLMEDRALSFNASATKSAGGATGKGGSMARFTITDNYLYAINNHLIQVFDIQNPAVPQRGNTVNAGWNIETIFPYQNKLFLGSSNGMYIFDNSQPAKPTMLSFFGHFFGCDPVVVEGNYAYVTIRNGTLCRSATAVNQLEVIDISNARSPRSVKIYPMQNPHGLGIDNGKLFLCEGQFGLKVFDAQNPLTIADKQLAHFKGNHMFDVIPLGNSLLTVGNDGLYQYDYTDPKNIRLLSKIAVSK